MEAARLGLHDFPLSALGGRAGPPGSLGSLSPEPWAAAAAAAAQMQNPAAAAVSLASLTHALPGFLSHPQAAYASYLTSPTGFLGPMGCITSLGNSICPVTSPPTTTTPPNGTHLNLGPCLTPKEQSDNNNGEIQSRPGCSPPQPLLPGVMPPLAPSSAQPNHHFPGHLVDDEDLHKKSLFSSFLPIRHLRLRAQEHLEQAVAAASAASSKIDKESGFDSSSSPIASSTAPPPLTITSSTTSPGSTSSSPPTTTAAYQQS